MNQHFELSAKRNGTQMGLVYDAFIVYMYCGMPTGAYQVELTSNHEKSKPVTLATVELRTSASWSVKQ